MECCWVLFGILGIVKAAKIKKPDLTAVNEVDLNKAMDQLKSNDGKLTTLNLNNHQEVTTEVLEDVAKAMKTNTNLKHLHLANTQMTDKTAKVRVLRNFNGQKFKKRKQKDVMRGWCPLFGFSKSH